MRRGKQHPIAVLIIILCCTGLITCTSNNIKKQQKNSDIHMTDFPQQHDEAKKLAKTLKGKGISDERVLSAIANIPRHSFIDEQLSAYAYLDRPLPIESGQTISQPFTVAYQTELLQLKPGEKVLEIGTGSGYQAAVLCEMEAEVYSIERYYNLYERAKETLNELGYYPNLFFGDGFEGLPEHAPFDKILITAAPEKVPEKLLQQLRVGGWMVAPVGGKGGQKMTLIRRISENKFKKSEHGDFIFVPMQQGIVE
ncbi:protein-L-isoaspartate(D-aspartate) O-methyltransferase [Proteiniphilum sp.]|uniref:protein-L-isoaspartate(D-aspartate) O-methyltransferase n=1 Tax=Proteiniphilum sp. TaxID=1926877 RepID=UPI002B1EE09D|nr:protein-L-isoaspartate(D-aspartate) O-methyltransferase [Proteiniphilum sp.]MEA4916160.1 protein-L-isoaspartate(D-aspartate) O-methyltransferase [Proteiniphilum sp.]